MGFGYDSVKRASNFARHGVDFEDVKGIWDGVMVTGRDSRHEYGEVRMISFGEIAGRVYAVVWTRRNDRIRLISARKANSRECAKYFERISGR